MPKNPHYNPRSRLPRWVIYYRCGSSQPRIVKLTYSKSVAQKYEGKTSALGEPFQIRKLEGHARYWEGYDLGPARLAPDPD